jgi:hemoglobin-like flavoprotein
MFGYDLETDVDGEFLEDPKFIAHSVQLIGMFDTALNMLGPDGTLLTEKIQELGEKHVKYGVRAEMFPIMGKGLYAMLEDQLGDGWTDETKQAWQLVFGVIANDLMLTVLKYKTKINGDPNDPAAVTA